MGNKTRGNGKTKKIIVGVATVVAVAAVAVPTSLALFNGKDNAGASNNRFNIIVSSGIENVPDYNLSISGQAKISELKTLLKGIEGYSITGIYKDESLRHPYLDSEIITENSKIYIGYERITLLVTIFDESGNQLGTPKEVFYKEALTLAEPSKPEDDFATYEFLGWYNERNEQVNLNEITSNLNIHPKFKTIMKEYRFGFTNSNNLDSISVSVGGEQVTLNDTYHYGSTIKLRATAKLGNEITEFKVTVDGRTVDVLTFANRVEEDGKVYYEIELTANGDLNIVYTEALSEYALTIPSGVTVKREGKTLQSGTKIKYGDELEITYTESEGHHKTEFRLEWAEHITGDLWKVTGDLNIIYTEERNEYSLGSIPSGVIVKRGTETLNSNSKIYYGDQLTFTYTETSNRYTGNTKQEAGYNYSEKETTTYVLKVNSSVLSNGSTITVSDNIALELSSSTSLSWEQSSRIEYSLGTIPSGVTVRRNGSTLSSNATIYYGDSLTISYTLPSGMKLTSFKVNNQNFTNGGTLSVTGNVNITFTYEKVEDYSYLSFSLNSTYGGYEVRGKDNSVSKVVIPSTYNGKPVVSIGFQAFYGYSNLVSVEIPSSIIRINSGAFYNCNNLEGNIYDNAKYLGNDENPYLFLLSATSKDILSCGINTNCKIINSSAFDSCTSLTTVNIPEGITEIKSNTFYKCSSLISVSLPSTLISIGEHAFSWCTSLKSVELPNGLETIVASAFYCCSNLTTINIPNSVTSIGNHAFGNCSKLQYNKYTSGSLTSGYLGNSENPYLYFATRNTTHNFWSGGEVQIHPDCKIICGNAFYKEENLTSIIIPNGVIEIGFVAFAGCNGLTSITIPSSVISLDGYAFSDCLNLKTVIIDSVEVYKQATGTGNYNSGALLSNATTVKVLKSIVDNNNNTNDYLNDTSKYNKTTSGNYYVYTKIS